MQFTQDPNKMKCPRTGLKKLCVDLRDTCPEWVKLIGTHPQTGERVDEYACALAWGPILQVEIMQKLSELGAAIESFRNQVVVRNEAVKQIDDNSVRGPVPLPVSDLLAAKKAERR